MDLEQALAGPQGQANGHVITAHLRWRGCEGAHTGSEAPRAQGRGEGWRSPWTSSPADAELGGGGSSRGNCASLDNLAASSPPLAFKNLIFLPNVQRTGDFLLKSAFWWGAPGWHSH